MEIVLSNAQMRLSDAYTIEKNDVSSAELMHRAGVAIAAEAENTAKTLKTDEILVICGTGNNGGDGFVCAEELRSRGFNVAVYALEGKLSADCQREKLAYKGRYLRHIWGAIIIDCIFGTGLDRNIAGEIYTLIEEINSFGAFVISADIPSGLSGDNGKVMGIAVNANKTVAIAEYKLGHFLNDGLDFCGEVVKKDIGICVPQEAQCYTQIYSDEDVEKFFAERKRNSHKGTFGTVNLIAGSKKYIGAAALSLQSALMSGCGIVKLTTAEEVKFALAFKYPQAIYSDEVDLAANAIAVGMGCGATLELYGIIKNILKEYEGTLLIDADGLNALSKCGAEILKDKKCAVVLTPHLKEFSRITGKTVEEISSDPVSCAESFAREYGVTLVLKSASTVITDGKNTVINVRGSTALSKGGSGDILSGFLSGTLARGLNPFEASVCACYTLGLSAEISSAEKTDFCATAYDIIKNIHNAVKRLIRKN
ncbi:MAG: NAD(P)H-hydrate dehydratase [Clostridia bacterium]|nr:NAD(P)H-hydrate dehydratase [Clostridia bacterium]